MPNLLIVGVGHSGTTILTRMLHELGWNIPEGDDIARGWAEPVAVIDLNDRLIEGETASDEELLAAWLSLPAPRAVKDPRLVLTLPRWIEFFSSQPFTPPVMIYIYRDFKQLEQSYARRNYRRVGRELGMYGHSLVDLRRAAERAYSQWPWARWRVSLEQLMQAIALFDLARPNRA